MAINPRFSETKTVVVFFKLCKLNQRHLWPKFSVVKQNLSTEIFVTILCKLNQLLTFPIALYLQRT